MIAALCKLNKDDFESRIIMNRLFHLVYIEKGNNIHGAFIFGEIRTYFSRLISLGPYTIVTSYDPDPTIPGTLHGQSHTLLMASLSWINGVSFPSSQ